MADTPNDKTRNTGGKRGDPSYAQVSGLIPVKLKREFKARVAREGGDMSEVLETLIRAYVEQP